MIIFLYFLILIIVGFMLAYKSHKKTREKYRTLEIAFEKNAEAFSRADEQLDSIKEVISKQKRENEEKSIEIKPVSGHVFEAKPIESLYVEYLRHRAVFLGQRITLDYQEHSNKQIKTFNDIGWKTNPPINYSAEPDYNDGEEITFKPKKEAYGF